MTDNLILEFVGEEYVVVPGRQLTFGRQGDVVIDDNKHLHRILGRVANRDGIWWIGNVGSAIPMQIADGEGSSFTRLAPGASVPISFASTKVTFEAGGLSYELDIRTDTSAPDLDDPDDVDGPELGNDFNEATETAVSLPLSPDQRLLLTALAESRLRPTASADALPTNRQVATSFGWSITTFNRKLDSLCRKYARAGVRGLQGTNDGVARDRRQRLVDYVIDAGIIDTDDLAALDAAR